MADAVTAVPGKRQLVGEGWSLRADHVEVLTGNAAGINVSINGQEMGAMGGVGAVVDRTWAMQQGQVKEVVADQPQPGPTPTA